MKHKKAIGMSFNWLFALIAGAAILGIAIYGAVNIVGTGTQLVSTESAAKLTTFLDPAKAGIAYGKKSPSIEFNKDVKIELSCSLNDNPPFGKQTLRFAEESFGKVSEFSDPIDIINNYVFSENILEGKEIHVYSKSVNMPFKIADLIILSSDQYCFVKTPEGVQDDLQDLENINFTEDINDCGERVKVCFKGTSTGSTSGCEIIVKDGTGSNYFTYGSVEKNGKNLYYYDSLMYAAIMASEENYECNLKRLMNKFVTVSNVYIKKISVLERNGCSSTVTGELTRMKTAAKNFDKSIDLKDRGIISGAGAVHGKNLRVAPVCKLYTI